jgi:hypothetical protein
MTTMLLLKTTRLTQNFILKTRKSLIFLLNNSVLCCTFTYSIKEPIAYNEDDFYINIFSCPLISAGRSQVFMLYLYCIKIHIHIIFKFSQGVHNSVACFPHAVYVEATETSKGTQQ